MAYAYEMHTSKIIPMMPEQNSALLNLSIPELNNLFTLLGKNAYEDVLMNIKKSEKITTELSAQQFKKITASTIEGLKTN